jgi:hypothetical protein
LPGKRVDAMRAGMTTTGFIEGPAIAAIYATLRRNDA